MGIVKVGVLAPTDRGVPLGVQGESRATEVEFDTRPWFREYPSGTVSAVARRDGDTAPYPLSLDVADGTAVWQVSDTDTAKAGEGAVELTMTSGGTRVRSLTFKTLVTASPTADMSMIYKRDINIAFDNPVQAVVAASAGE